MYLLVARRSDAQQKTPGFPGAWPKAVNGGRSKD
jgi:hypothetical protein